MILMVVALTARTAPAVDPVTFHVAPDGKDEWSGKVSTPNPAGNDGPFATATRARDAVRQLKREQGGTLRQPVNIVFRGGTYLLNEPLLLTPEDSGTEQCPVTYAAREGETPVLSGGRLLTGWQPVEVDGKKLWSAPAPPAAAGDVTGGFFRQLWSTAADGRRLIRARQPDKGYLTIAEVPGDTGDWQAGKTAFRFRAGDVKAWPGLTESGAEAVVMSRWVESHLPITAVDEGRRLIAFALPTVFTIGVDDPYYFEGAMAFLDQPGEWFLDRTASKIYYLPAAGEDPAEAQLIAPSLPHALRLAGEPAADRYVEHVTFRGLTFSHTHWWFAKPEGNQPAPSGASQAAHPVPGAVYAEGARHCAFERCTIAHAGNYGIDLSGGCRNNRVAGCDLFDLGAGGVRVGEKQLRADGRLHTSANQIIDCHVHHVGTLFHSAVGIWVGQSYDNTIARNHVHDLYYTGLSVGWTWGYDQSLCRGNVIESNHVHHVGRLSDGDGPILSDLGGIYTLGVQPGTVIRGNVFHDIAAHRYGGWGIYFDEGSSNILAENNLVYRTTHGGFHQHYGRDNTVRNNIFALGRDAQLMRTRNEDHRSFTFENNVVYWKDGQPADPLGSDWNGGDAGRFMMDRNLYWHEGGDPNSIRFGGQTLEQWQAKGLDRNSKIADPKFRDAAKDNFALTKDSPAWGLGFKPFDLTPAYEAGKR